LHRYLDFGGTRRLIPHGNIATEGNTMTNATKMASNLKREAAAILRLRSTAEHSDTLGQALTRVTRHRLALGNWIRNHPNASNRQALKQFKLLGIPARWSQYWENVEA